LIKQKGRPKVDSLLRCVGGSIRLRQTEGGGDKLGKLGGETCDEGE
jgi:hypothetical protein